MAASYMYTMRREQSYLLGIYRPVLDPFKFYGMVLLRTGNSSSGEYQISANLQSGRGSRPTRAYGHDQVISVAVTANNQIMLNLSSGRTVEVTDVKEFSRESQNGT